MIRFMRESLTAKIATVMSLMMLSLLVLAGAALIGIQSMAGHFTEVVHEISEEVEPVILLQTSLRKAVAPVTDYLVNGRPSERENFAQASAGIERAFKKAMAAHYQMDPERASLISAYGGWRRARESASAILALDNPVGNSTISSTLARMDSNIDRAIDLLGELQEQAYHEIRREFVAAKAAGDRLSRIVSFLVALGFLIAVAANVVLTRSILMRLKVLTRAAQAISEGNFKHRVSLTSDDELGRLARAFNTMAAEVDKNQQGLREISIHDPLTGLYNRRGFDLRIREELQRSGRYRSPFALLILDIDHFKCVNDTRGHPAGDRVLQEVADIARKTARISDHVARYGGEEFAIVLPETDRQGAFGFARRLLAAVAGHAFLASDGNPLRLTVSIGVASSSEDGDSQAKLVEVADSALYAAKHAGRNCVRAFGLEQGTETRR
jgi:two-component system, cell cycle response regulator